MSLNNLYILPENVKLIPVGEITEPMKAKFEYEEDDFVITHTNARQTSKVIDAASASLLKTFKTPTTMVEGIFKYAVINNIDPQETAEQAYAVLSKFRNEGFLIPFDAEATVSKNSTLNAGDIFEGYTIIEKIQGIEDTQVYKVKKSGANYLLKILKTTPSGNGVIFQQFQNEVTILSKLNNVINPALIKNDTANEEHYIITDWFEGKPADQFAEQFRNINNPENLHRLLTVCINIVDAYSKLHLQGITHGDIHPRNILVANNNDVCIIDYGLASMQNQQTPITRGGISFFFDPEYARALAEHKRPPASDFAGEQYAIAAILYYILSGKYYTNFSYEKDILLQQVINDLPQPFITHDIEIDNAIEQIIFKALSKEKASRFSSVEKFKEALSSVVTNLFNKKTVRQESYISAIAFCGTIKSRFGINEDFINSGLHVAPFASVNYGAAGIAYMFYRMALIESDPELLTTADIWCNRAMRFMQNEETAFYSKELDLTKDVAGEISIYHTESGVYLVQALINKTMGLQHRFQASVSGFIAAASKPCDNIDATIGKASVLVGASLLMEEMDNDDSALKNELLDFGNNILKEIWDITDKYDNIINSKEISYRGVAHGWAGILYATICWCNKTGATIPVNFYARTEELIAVGIEEKNYIRWNVTENNPASWTGWCHGSAGYTLLWCTIYQYANDEKYLALAKKSANHFLATSSSLNISLCCGLSGECYALLRLFNITYDDFYLQQAKAKAKKILPNAYAHEARNHSLYKGDIGAAVLLTEMNKPEYARMPLFE